MLEPAREQCRHRRGAIACSPHPRCANARTRCWNSGLRTRCRISASISPRLDATAAFVAEVIRAELSDAARAAACALAAFCFSGRDLWAEIADETRMARRGGARSRGIRSRHRLGAARCRRRRGLALSRSATGLTVGRSEGLALASLRMFEAGAFLRRSARSVARRCERLVGADRRRTRGRLSGQSRKIRWAASKAAPRCWRGSAARLLDQPDVFATRDTARPGGLFDHLAQTRRQVRVAAPDILQEVLAHLGSIWPSRITLGGVLARRYLAASGRSSAPTRPTVWCRSTSCRNG